MARVLFVSPVASDRIARARAWLDRKDPARPLLVVAASADAASDLVRATALARGAVFGWERLTLGRLAATLAEPELARRHRVPAGLFALEALCARVVHERSADGGSGLGRFAAVASWPGFPRALARTLDELRLAGLTADELAAHDADLASLYQAYDGALARSGIADKALVLELATAVVRAGSATTDAAPDAGAAAAASPLLGCPLVLLDVAVTTTRERELVAALVERAPDALATLPAGDDRSERTLGAWFKAQHGQPMPEGAPGLRRLQERLFDPRATSLGSLGDDVAILSWPGESRECVEIARSVLAEAARGVPFDRMAVLLRAPSPYRAHLEEAFRRAGIPAHFSAGTVKPDPSGRAFLSLLACAAEGLSAARFAEYLSLGEVPDAAPGGAPPQAAPASVGPGVPEEELLPRGFARAQAEAALEEVEDADGDGDGADGARGRPPGEVARDDTSGPAAPAPASAPVVAGTLRAPRRWESLLVDAAVIGGADRWRRRLDGLAHAIALELGAATEDSDVDAARAERLRRDAAALEALRNFALPLLDDLAALPASASWGTWVETLRALASRALRQPERVVAVLDELRPMAEVGPVAFSEVRLVLGRKLAELVVRAAGRRAGKLYVAPLESARGLAFDAVFVPGLAEKLFPQKVSEDPILRDKARKALGRGLVTRDERVGAERLALRIAVGAARDRVVLSYPRIDVEQSRPRVPSFYGLEVLRAAEGRLPGFDELARRAGERGGASRLGWPAPARPEDAVDEAEHDLAVLSPFLHGRKLETLGPAHYLLGANPYLGRALRHRAKRWLRKWTYADGLVDPGPEGATALAAHALTARSYSPTALQHFAACPYRFYLQAVVRLSPRETRESIEELDPLQKGSLVHEVQFELLQALQGEGLLPVTPARLDAARARLDAILAAVADRYHDDLAPAIERVWEDGIAAIKADVRDWLRRLSEDQSGFEPWRFELAFGLAEPRGQRDEHSSGAPAALDAGVMLRGSIDLVERRADGTLRATDYKTGKVRAERSAVVGGGETLQPVLYALALEKLVPGSRVESGRLYYCTSTGGFEERVVPLDDIARASVRTIVETVGKALAQGFLPAAPKEGACTWCDYAAVCGPYEEHRARRVKSQKELEPLLELRKMP